MEFEVRRRRGDGDATLLDRIREDERDEELASRASQGLPEPPEWTGPLTPNDKLTHAEHIYENKVKGPESIVYNEGYIYTGTSDGRVVSIFSGEVRTLARLGTGENCGSFDDEPICGRPLGMRMDNEGYLVVADAYLGIFKINVATGSVHKLLSAETPLAGKVAKFFNDVEIGEDGLIYFTDSSTRWDRRHNRYLILEGDMTGRLLSFDPATGSVQELVTGLAFANGIQLSPDKSHILIAETTKTRILRYHIKGPKKGTVDVFSDNLPGMPDNIRKSGRGTYWIGLASIRRAHKFSLLDWAAPRPWVRSLITKFLSQNLMMSLLPKYGLLLEVDKEGRIIKSFHDPTGETVPSVSEAEEHNGVLYLGSYYLPFLSRFYLYK
ncbi:adipocyte plasma membrane-associated protein-like isoform X2 [Pomacea canaliculata]|uniref:adipocyte plasma membrane-associated protein-like isoform X2 n=1 Tax=Pomacea canaliculata TaxID=400727 RepID=UPI000D72EF03|nr:adipocyte plasma membrane-associated protein-like isoform X2 [Pomacea canaliculata]